MTIQPSQRPQPSGESMIRRGADVIHIEARALDRLAKSLTHSFAEACQAILTCAGRVVVTGMGKSGHIGRKWAATLAATGTPAFYVHPAEAAHGDLGMLVPGDVLIVISNSGNTSELKAFLHYAATIGVPVIGVASRPDSILLQAADVKVCLPETREACPSNIAPTTSTTMQLALGDAIAMTLMDVRGFSRDGLKTLHPGGSLGLRLTAVSEIMHTANALPLVDSAATMEEVIVTMTCKGFGTAGVIDGAGQLIGVITDGDLRRHFHKLTSARAAEVMSSSPKTLTTATLAEDALTFLSNNKISCAFVMSAGTPVCTKVPVGIVHMHDFVRLGLR